MHTTRPEFPRNTQEWTQSPAIFTKDSLVIHNHHVMETWEAGYMETLAEIVTQNGGNVLEIGFGLGISSNFILSSLIGKAKNCLQPSSIYSFQGHVCLTMT